MSSALLVVGVDADADADAAVPVGLANLFILVIDEDRLMTLGVLFGVGVVLLPLNDEDSNGVDDDVDAAVADFFMSCTLRRCADMDGDLGCCGELPLMDSDADTDFVGFFPVMEVDDSAFAGVVTVADAFGLVHFLIGFVGVAVAAASARSLICKNRLLWDDTDKDGDGGGSG